MVWVMMCSFLCSGWMKVADYRFERFYWQAYGVLHAINCGKRQTGRLKVFQTACCFQTALTVQCTFVGSQCCFMHHFGQGRMGMDDAGDVFAAGGEFEGSYAFGNQFAHHRADHVHAQDAVGFGIGQHFNRAFGFAQSQGAAVCAEAGSAFFVPRLRL